MRFSALLLIFGLLFLQHKTFAQANWNLKKDKNGIKVFTRKSNKFKLDEIKVECNLQGTPSQLAAVLLDVNDHPSWVYKTISCNVVKNISPSELYYYTQISCPWPFENRDLVVDMNFTQNKTTKVTTVDINNVSDYIPKKEGFVRIAYSSVKWVLTPLNNKTFNVDYTIQADPSGSLPIWLLNLFISKGPYESFMSLKERMQQPKYAQAKLPFILE